MPFSVVLPHYAVLATPKNGLTRVLATRRTRDRAEEEQRRVKAGRPTWVVSILIIDFESTALLIGEPPP